MNDRECFNRCTPSARPRGRVGMSCQLHRQRAPQRRCSARYSTIVLAGTAAMLLLSSPALAVVVISDGFGDADLNNNGIPLEDVDVNVQGSLGDTTYVPGRLEDGSGTEPENNEVTSVLDASDTGIRWLQMRGFTSAPSTSIPGPGNSKPTIRIVDDSQGAMQETMSVGMGGLGIAAINSGYAMSWESRGGGSSAVGFFDRRIALGTEVDDEVKLSFDFRIWRDAPNQNGNNFNNEPSFGELRFGLYQDTDNQLGQTNPFAGRQVDENGDPLPNLLTDFKPAVWGQEEGMFEGSLTNTQGPGDDVGTNGDNGWWASAILGNAVIPNGGLSRIKEELQSDRVLQGSDVHTVAQPENMAAGPFDPPIFDFVNMDIANVYNIELSLRRATETAPGDTIFATLTITDKATGDSFSYGGQEDFSDPVEGGVQSDAWDYFGIRNATSGAAEFDFILDNFMVEVIGSNAGLAGDFNGDSVVDAADYTVWRNGLGTTFTQDDYELWKTNYGASLGLGGGSISSTGATVPEPGSLLLISLAAAWLLARVPRSLTGR